MVDVEEKQIKNSEGNLKFIHATKDDDIYRIGYCLPIDTLYKLNNTEIFNKERTIRKFFIVFGNANDSNYFYCNFKANCVGFLIISCLSINISHPATRYV